MVIQVHHMSTVKFKVPNNRIKELVADLRKTKVRHYPFRKDDGGVEVELFPTKKISYFLLKYTLTNQ